MGFAVPPALYQAAGAVDTSLLLTFGWFYPACNEADLPACSEGDGLIYAHFLQGLACGSLNHAWRSWLRGEKRIRCAACQEKR